MNQLPRSIEEHIEYLQQKGMSFLDKETAIELFSRVSYARLKYYWRDLIDEDSDDNFKDGATGDSWNSQRGLVGVIDME